MEDVFDGREPVSGGEDSSRLTAGEALDGVDRAADNVGEALETARALGAIARQLRVLASNTSIEAANLPTATALGEIAHRMRLLSEQVAEVNATLLSTLQVQALTLEEVAEGLRGADAPSPTPSSSSGWSR